MFYTQLSLPTLSPLYFCSVWLCFMPLSFQRHFFSTCITFLVSVCVGMITRKHLSSTPTPPTSLTCGRRRCCRTPRTSWRRNASTEWDTKICCYTPNKWTVNKLKQNNISCIKFKDQTLHDTCFPFPVWVEGEERPSEPTDAQSPKDQDKKGGMGTP